MKIMRSLPVTNYKVQCNNLRAWGKIENETLLENTYTKCGDKKWGRVEELGSIGDRVE